MPFTFRQRNSAGFGAGTTCSLSLANNPAVGDVVCVALFFSSNVSAVTVQDANGNNYVVSSKSPQQVNTSATWIWVAYLVTPVNAHKTLTATWTTNSGSSMLIDCFWCNGGRASFDNDFKATGSSTTVNSPTVTPTGTYELTWACAGTGGSLSAPTTGGTAGPWTGSNSSTDNVTEYDLETSSGQAVNFTNTNADWGSMALAFSFAQISNPYLGIFSKDSVLSCGAFDMGVPNARYGWYDDDFVAQFSGTTVGATVSGIASVPPGVFSKDATLDGAFDD